MQVIATMRRTYGSLVKSGSARSPAAQTTATVREGRTSTSLRRKRTARRAWKARELAMALRRTARPSALLLESHPVQPLGPGEEDGHHHRERHRSLEERALGKEEDGDRLDVSD